MDYTPIPASGYSGERPTNATELPGTEAAAISLILAGGGDGPEAWERAKQSRVSSEHFNHQALRIIWGAAADVARSGAVPDAISISDRLGQLGELERVGGDEKLEEMVKAAPGAWQIPAVFDRLEDAARRRRILKHSKALAEMANDPDVPIEIVERHASESPDFTRRTSNAPTDVVEFCEAYREQRPVLVESFLRRSEVAVFVSAAKVGKSWLGHSLAVEFLRSGSWLGFQTYGQGKRVLLVDLELTRQGLAGRLQSVTADLGVDLGSLRGKLVIESTRYERGERGPVGFDAVRSAVMKHQADLVIIDSLYQAYPDDPRFSENDNAAMARHFKDIKHLAEESGSALLLVHHVSKGSQTGKASIDLGAGAGSLQRSVDNLLSLRQHEAEDCYVCELNPRSFRPVHPFVVRRVVDGNGLRWQVEPDEDPTRLLGAPQSAEDKREERKQRAEKERNATEEQHDGQVIRGLEVNAPTTWVTKSQLATHAKLSNANADRSVIRLLTRKELTARARDKRTTEYLLTSYLPEVTEAENRAKAAAEKTAASEDLYSQISPHTPLLSCPEQQGGTGIASGQPDNEDCPVSGPEKTSVKRSKRNRADKNELSGTVPAVAGSTSSTTVSPVVEGWC